MPQISWGVMKDIILASVRTFLDSILKASYVCFLRCLFVCLYFFYICLSLIIAATQPMRREVFCWEILSLTKSLPYQWHILLFLAADTVIVITRKKVYP